MVKLNFIERFFWRKILKKIMAENPNPVLPAKPIDFRNPDELVKFAQTLDFLKQHGLNTLFQLAEWRGSTEMAALNIDKTDPKHLYYQLGRVSAFYSLRSVVDNIIERAKKEADKFKNKIKE